MPPPWLLMSFGVVESRQTSRLLIFLIFLVFFVYVCMYVDSNGSLFGALGFVLGTSPLVKSCLSSLYVAM